MKKFAAIVAYDGTRFAGWQEQEKQRTVAGALQHSFKEVFDQEIKVLGASRTDAGVHARHQVLRFHADSSLACDLMKVVWSRRLPLDIHIHELHIAAQDFHPHRNIENKHYEYHVYTARPLPHESLYGWFIDQQIDMTKLHECLQLYIGTHDFRSFCTGNDITDTIRTIKSISIEIVSSHKFIIHVKGPSFLRYMVRRLVGSALTIATKKHLNMADLLKIFKSCNPAHNLVTAPAHGLHLAHILYAHTIFL
jgi:tRNA pseudouridine38-40 synthase